MQGCGISPLFFILALEVLALAVLDNPHLEGISIFNVSKKLNLLTDDGLLALKWTENSFKELLNVLQNFEDMSNLSTNKHKSLVFKIGKIQMFLRNCLVLKIFHIILVVSSLT